MQTDPPWVSRLEGKIDRLLTLLEAGRGPRDTADQSLVLALAHSTKGLAFTGAELWRHRDVDPALAEALEDADVDTPQQLGKLLRRCAGCDVGGWRVERVGTDRQGIQWRVRECESDPRNL